MVRENTVCYFMSNPRVLCLIELPSFICVYLVGLAIAQGGVSYSRTAPAGVRGGDCTAGPSSGLVTKETTLSEE